jgi:hypothetical protein
MPRVSIFPEGESMTFGVELLCTTNLPTNTASLVAWCRILETVAEQREALLHRIWREDPDDVLLEADCQTWCELAQALADFLKARRAA